VSIEAKNKVLNLISAENNRLVELVRTQRSHQSRASAFRDALAAIGSDGTPANANMATSLKLMIGREEKEAAESELKIEDSKNRKDALEQFVTNLSTPSRLPPPKPKSIIGQDASKGPENGIKLPIRRPDYDYAHKDLREGSDIYRVREFLRKAGVPMLLSDIVKFLFPGDENDVKHGKYANLRGTLTGYANENRIFTIESKTPHVIGLIEFRALSGGFKTPLV
jgi:hypothetical protein